MDHGSVFCIFVFKGGDFANLGFKANNFEIAGVYFPYIKPGDEKACHETSQAMKQSNLSGEMNAG